MNNKLKKNIIKIYLDTNICLDLIEDARGNTNSKYLFDKSKSDKQLVCVISLFSQMELIDNLQQLFFERKLSNSGYQVWEIRANKTGRELENGERNIVFKRYEKFIDTFNKKLLIYSFIDKNWKLAIQLLKDTNIKAPDALHLAAALSSGSQLFASSDKKLIKAIKDCYKISSEIFPLDCSKSISSIKFISSFEKDIKKINEKIEEPVIDENIDKIKKIGEIFGAPSMDEMEKGISEIEKEYEGKS